MGASIWPALRRVATASACATLVVAATACQGGGAGGDAAESYPSETVEIMVPAAAGGGWDSTGRALQKVASDEKLTEESVEVFNVEGGGGATGLAQLQRDKGDPYHLMMTGLVMIGALQKANSPVKLTDTTPIATLTAEAEAFVVRSDSKFQTINDVVDAYKADPSSVTFGGGSAGGSDHLVVGELVKAAGGQPADLKYVGYSGGGEATAGILSGDVAVGVSGVSEFVEQIKAGDMRLLAISTAKTADVAGKPAPTLTEAGYDVDFANWRAIVAAPGLSEEETAAAAAFVDKIHASEGWKKALEQNGWTDFYQAGPAARTFLDGESTRVSTLLQDLGL